MSEENKTKKKLRIVWQILKWIGLGILSLLLIAEIYFQAPWKVIALLTVIFLACTALPKPYRKYFWLSVGTVVIALIIWVFLPEDNEGWKPYKFEEEIAAFEARYGVPDDEEYAAVIYNEVIAGIGEDGLYSELSDEQMSDWPIREPWLSEEKPEIAQWLKQQQGRIQKLLEASKIEKCGFQIPTDMLSMTTDRLASMRQLAYLLISSANNDFGEGRMDQAIEKNLAILQMGKHLCQQPTMIDVLVGIAIESLATSQLNEFVIYSGTTEGHLSVIEQALVEIKHDWNTDFPMFLENDRLMAKNTICGLAYQINPKGKTRLSRDPTAVMRAECGDETPQLTYWRKKLFKIWAVAGWFFMPSTPQKAGEIIDAKHERFRAMTEPDFDWQREPPELFSLLTRWNFTGVTFNFNYLAKLTVDMSEEGYYGLHDIYLRTISQQKRGSRLLIALRRFKNETDLWPERLDEVESFAPAEIFVDPINGSGFVYKLTEENFTLYSKGKNGIDEDGQYNSEWDPNTLECKVEEDDRLIWPPKIPKIKEETSDAEQQ